MNEDIKARREALRKMRTMHKKWEAGENPGVNEDVNAGSIVCLLGISVAFIFKDIPWVSLITLTVVLVLLITLRFRRIFSPKTWSEPFDRMLTDYQPADVDAFRQLQDDVTEQGELTADIFGKWLQVESQLVMPERENTTQYTFASRIIQDDKDARP